MDDDETHPGDDWSGGVRASSTSSSSPVVALRVGPELFADALGRVLIEHGLAVNRLRAAEDQTPEPVRMLVTTPRQPSPEEAEADIEVWVSRERSTNGTAVVVDYSDGRADTKVADLDGLVELVLELVSGPGASPG